VRGLAAFDWFSHTYNIIGENISKRPSRRIFLSRRGIYGRTLSNLADIERITLNAGFETIYAEDLSFSKQVELFGNTEFLVALHGAGIANTMFSQVDQLSCLEVHTASYVVPCYYWLMQQLGAKYYDGILGTELDRNGQFRVDPAAFESALARMVGQQRAAPVA
jgi:capsular polysaccharide biosynthesis protein